MALKSMVALVTGAGRGLGREIALALAKEGADIVVNDVDLKNAEEVAGEVISLGRRAVFSNASVSSREQVELMFKEIREVFGRLDILVNNAGITRDGLLMTMQEEQWDLVMDVNLKGVFNCCQHAAKMMSEQNFGKIVNLSSIAGQMGNMGQINYSASKAGVIGMTKTLAKELARYNINVNAVAPGIIQTPMTETIPEKVMDSMLKQIPFRRIGQPKDIANLVKFLVSEDSEYVTGQVIACNGGWYM